VQQLLSWSKLPGHLVPEEGQEDEKGYPISAARAMGIILLSAVWEWLLDPLGFLIITPLYLIACSWVMSVRSWMKVIGSRLSTPLRVGDVRSAPGVRFLWGRLAIVRVAGFYF